LILVAFLQFALVCAGAIFTILQMTKFIQCDISVRIGLFWCLLHWFRHLVLHSMLACCCPEALKVFFCGANKRCGEWQNNQKWNYQTIGGAEKKF
jgi:hypothetical protein